MDNEYKYDEETLEALREPLETHQQAESRVDDAVMEIRRISDAIALDSNVKQAAIELYEDALEVELPFYPSVAELAAGAVYVACRTTETPRTRREVAAHSSLPRYTYNYPTHEEGERNSLRREKQRKVDR